MDAAAGRLDLRAPTQLLRLHERRQETARGAVAARLAEERRAAQEVEEAGRILDAVRGRIVATQAAGLAAIREAGSAPAHRIETLRLHLEVLAGEAAVREVLLQSARDRHAAAVRELQAARATLARHARDARKWERAVDRISEAREREADRVQEGELEELGRTGARR